MRIAYLSYSAIPSRSANAVHVMKMCQAFARQGHDVTLYAQFGHEPAEDAYRYYGVARSFRIVQCWWPPLKDLGGVVYGALVALALAARPRPDVCHGRDIYSVVMSSLLGIPMILESHVPPRTIVGRTLQTWVFKRPNFVRLVVITEALRQEYRRIFPWLAEEKMLVAPDGADLPARAEPPAIDAAWTRRPGCLQVGYVGHLYAGRGIDIILAAARQVPEMDFHVLGGMEEDVARWRRVASGITNLRLHGHVPPAAAEAFRQAMDILLAPYQQTVIVEGGKLETTRWMSPMKLFEYMASRKPIIASDMPVLREVLRPDANALLVPPADVAAWIRALRALAQDAALRERLAGQAYQDVSMRFTWEGRAGSIVAGLSAGAAQMQPAVSRA